MSFKETDFPGLIDYLKKIVNQESDPAMVKELVLKLVKLYDEVPLYPGIVNMCLGGVAKGIKPSEIKVGQKIFVKNQDDYYSGVVSSLSEDGIVLKSAQSVTVEEDFELEFGDMEKITAINEEVLQEMWPSLVFNKE